MNPEEQNPKKETEFGPMIGIFLIVLLMIFGAVYYFINEVKDVKTRKQEYEQAIDATNTTEIIYATSTATTTP